MATQSSKKKQNRSIFNIEIPPVRTNTYSINISEEDSLIHISFAWIPPEKRDEVYVVNRLVFGTATARRLANDILKFLDEVESKKKE